MKSFKAFKELIGNVLWITGFIIIAAILFAMMGMSILADMGFRWGPGA